MAPPVQIPESAGHSSSAIPMDQNTGTGRATILYQSECESFTLLDLPESIASAQMEDPSSVEAAPRVFSSRPPLEPYPSTEPKSTKARANIQAHMEPAWANAPQIEALIQAGLADIRAHHSGEWCRPRLVHPQTAQPPRKRKAEMLASEAGIPETIGPEEWRPLNTFFDGRAKAKPAWILARSSPENTASGMAAVAQRLMVNPTSTPSTLCVGADAATTFHVPGHASFFLDDINAASAACWSAAVSRQWPHPNVTAGPGQFDLIVLDPPWHNASARRANAYDIARETAVRRGPFGAVADVLGPHLAPDAVVACWVTNRSAARVAAAQAFATWGVGLAEEWVWIKTTARGEPVTALEGLWRKPYEVLLVGRKDLDNDRAASEGGAARAEPRRRLIAAVPDLHSRKPCLRQLLEPLLAASEGPYRGLEVFARYLSHGWSAWGNEVLKFSSDECWQEAPITGDSSQAKQGAKERSEQAGVLCAQVAGGQSA